MGFSFEEARLASLARMPAAFRQATGDIITVEHRQPFDQDHTGFEKDKFAFKMPLTGVAA